MDHRLLEIILADGGQVCLNAVVFIKDFEQHFDFIKLVFEQVLVETDIVDNATLEANGLKEVQTVFRSKACLIERKGEFSDQKRALMDMILARIDGILMARGSKYIMLHAPKDKIEEVVRLLPGAEHPTLLPMADDDSKIVMHMVSRETLFWETMEKLKALGASSILVLPIEKMLK